MNLLYVGDEWVPVDEERERFEVRDRETGEVEWEATRLGLLFDSNARPRATADAYFAADDEDQFVTNFVDGWSVMHLDRFDLE